MVQRTAKLLEGGKWGLVGGFMDRDETLTQAIEREIYEETGWKVKDIEFLGIVDNPNRRHEDRQNISFVCTCTATEKTGEPDWESDDQKWFPLDKLPDDEQIAFDHKRSIELYKSFKKGEVKPLVFLSS